MASSLNALGSLGAKVAASLDDDADQRRHAIGQAEKLFLASAMGSERRSPPFGRRFAVAVATAALGLSALVWFIVERPLHPLDFTIDGSAGQAETWLAAPEARPVVVKFSDGTVVNVEPHSRARVVDTDKNGAVLALESGSLSAKVVHTSYSAWRLIAGPFVVRVTGTRFDLHWDTASQKFSITVREGSVGVAGSIVGAERPVRGGETLIASVSGRTFDLVRSEGTADLSDNDEPRTAPIAEGPTVAQPRLESASSTASPVPPPPEAPLPDVPAKGAAADWRDLAKQGDLRQAFAAANAQGFQGICDGATPAELLLLGDAARVSGRADRAVEALSTLRRRYPHDPRRAAAAFALGKVAFDQRHAYSQAAAWFSSCVREQPSGPLVREALGRQVEALKNAGDVAEARRTALEYLTRYPDGPHADIARAALK